MQQPAEHRFRTTVLSRWKIKRKKYEKRRISNEFIVERRILRYKIEEEIATRRKENREARNAQKNRKLNI